MKTYNICSYREEYFEDNLKNQKLLDCVLIWKCGVIKSDMLFSYNV